MKISHAELYKIAISNELKERVIIERSARQRAGQHVKGPNPNIGVPEARVPHVYRQIDKRYAQIKAPKVLGGVALAGGLAYGGKKLYDYLKTEKTAMFRGFVDESIKIAEKTVKEKAKDFKPSEPPTWLRRGAQIAGISLGAGLGAYTGDIVSNRLMGINNPNLRNLARGTGAALTGLAAAGITSKLNNRVISIAKGDDFNKDEEK